MSSTIYVIQEWYGNEFAIRGYKHTYEEALEWCKANINTKFTWGVLAVDELPL